MPVNKHIPFSRPLLLGTEEVSIRQALSNGVFSGNGPFALCCERQMESVTGAFRVLLTPSCTHALELSALLCGLEPGDEVILPSFAFSSTANAFVSLGAVPVFVDVRASDMNIDPEKLEEVLSPRTKAVVALHYGGMACEMEALISFAERHGLYLIEDAAQALGASYGGKPLGSFGQVAAISFHETKNVHCGEGGALLINKPDWIEPALAMRDKGTNRHDFLAGKVEAYEWTSRGSSYLCPELSAAFLHAQLQQLDKITVRRRTLWALYERELKPLEEAGCVQLPEPIAQSRHNGHLFFLRCSSEAERAKLSAHLRERGISAYFHYTPLHLSPAGKRYGRCAGKLPVTERESRCLLRLPLYFELTEEEILRISRSVKAFYFS